MILGCFLVALAVRRIPEPVRGTTGGVRKQLTDNIMMFHLNNNENDAGKCEKDRVLKKRRKRSFLKVSVYLTKMTMDALDALVGEVHRLARVNPLDLSPMVCLNRIPYSVWS